jgi:DNA-binding response OmpR family regulator
MHVGILDIDIPTAQLIRTTLSNIGITQTYVTRSSRDMVEILTEKPVDILVVEWDSRPESGIDLTRFLRSAESPNRILPIILTTSRADPADHRIAIDAGVNEIVVKPFTVRTILSVITTVIDKPRKFIITKNFVGPDRRSGKPPPPGIKENRTAAEPVVIPKSSLGDVFVDDAPRVILPDFSLKQRLESSSSRMAGIDGILTREEASKHEEDYVQWMLNDVGNIRQAYKALFTSSDSHGGIERISSAALSIRSRGIRSNYTFAARVATALHDFCQKKFTEENPSHVLIIEKHVDTLQAILNAKLIGDENPVGRELMLELQMLVKRYTLG